MDRTTIYAIAITTIVLTLIGGVYLAPAPGSDLAGRKYAAEDIRHKLQEDEIKERRRNKGRRPPPVESEPEVFSDNEAPGIEESADESAEAPPIE